MQAHLTYMAFSQSTCYTSKSTYKSLCHHQPYILCYHKLSPQQSFGREKNPILQQRYAIPLNVCVSTLKSNTLEIQANVTSDHGKYTTVVFVCTGGEGFG